MCFIAFLLTSFAKQFGGRVHLNPPSPTSSSSSPHPPHPRCASMDRLYLGNTVLQNDKKQTAYCNLFSADMSVIVAGWGSVKQQKMPKDLHEVQYF
jgi:hypothetical protein